MDLKTRRTSVVQDICTSTLHIVSPVEDETINVFRQTGVKPANHCSPVRLRIDLGRSLLPPPGCSHPSEPHSAAPVCVRVCVRVCVCVWIKLWMNGPSRWTLTGPHRAWLSPDATRARGGIQLIDESLAKKVQLDWTRGASLLLDFTWEGNKTQEPNLWHLHHVWRCERCISKIEKKKRINSESATINPDRSTSLVHHRCLNWILPPASISGFDGYHHARTHTHTRSRSFYR